MELEYRTEERAPAETRLEEGEGGCMVTFRSSPAWVALIGVGVGFATAGMHLVGAAYLMWMFSSPPFAQVISVVGAWKLWGMYLASGLFWVATAVINLRGYRLYGHIPRALAVNVGSGTLATRSERSARWRSWPLEGVESVRVVPVKSVFGGTAGAAVVVGIRGRVLPLRFRFGARDVGVAERFAGVLRGAVEGRGWGMLNAER